MSFLQTTLPKLEKPVHRLGLAVNYGIDDEGVDEALERGLNYIFYTAMRTGRSRQALRRALARDRARYVVATGPSMAFFGANVRSACEARLRELGTDRIDVFQLFWLGKTSAWTEGTIDALHALKAEGKIGAFGISIHDRPRAAALAASLDLLMIRYNAAHPGAEREIFPALAHRGEAERPAVVAYTATSWRRLLKRPRGWKGRVATAADAYRFCLSSADVDVVLTAPASASELRENLAGLERGALDEDEQRWLRELGALTG